MASKNGYLEIICGSMFCGKTEELIRRLKRLKIANKKYQLFKPQRDDRYGNDVTTHDQVSLDAEVVKNSLALLQSVDSDTEVVGIDEVQFFDNEIISVIETLNKNGKTVIASGLDMYASGQPFGTMPILLAKAKYVHKLHAVCIGCGRDALFSHAIGEDKDVNKQSSVNIGSFGKYIAVCENCRDDF